MIIRNARQSDLNGILDIYNDAILNTTAVYEYEPFTQDYIQQWFNEKQAAQLPVIILEDASQVAGFCTYGSFRNRAAYRTTSEHSVYVHPAFRGKGYGHILLDEIERVAQENGVHLLIGGIDASNQLSIDLHKKHGFHECGRIHQVAFKFDQWLDLVFMEKILQR